MASRPPKRSPIAGGILFVIGSIGGALVGLHFGQTTVGFLIGMGAAALLSLAIWALDSRSA